MDGGLSYNFILYCYILREKDICAVNLVKLSILALIVFKAGFELIWDILNI